MFFFFQGNQKDVRRSARFFFFFFFFFFFLFFRWSGEQVREVSLLKAEDGFIPKDQFGVENGARCFFLEHGLVTAWPGGSK